jgi:DHA1 family inner membrane transport protein
MYAVLIVLILFSLGAEHYIMTGIIQYIAEGLHITLSQASYINSIYFVGAAISGPIMILLIRNKHKITALSILSICIISGNLLIYFFPSYNTLIIGRLIASLAHSTFFGLSTVMIYQLSQKNKAFNVQLVSCATTVANTIAVPFCVKLSQSYSWEYSFLFVAISSSIGLIILLLFTCCNNTQIRAQNINQTKFINEIKHLLKNKSANSILLVSFLNYLSFFVTVSFLSVIITESMGFPKESLGKILGFIGSGMIFGGFLGSILYDKFHSKTAPIYISICLILTSLSVALFHNQKNISIFCLFIFQILSFSLVPYYKTKIVSKACSAPNLIATVNNVTLMLGSAAGAIIAGKLIQNYTAIQMPFFSAIISSVTAIAIIYNCYLDTNYKCEFD